MSRSFEIPDSELRFEFSTASGPGGQNVNKVATKARVTFDVGASEAFSDSDKALILGSDAIKQFRVQGHCIAITSQEHRSQLRNREACIAKLYELLRRALVRPKKRRPTKATKASKEKRLKSKKITSDRKSYRRRPVASD